MKSLPLAGPLAAAALVALALGGVLANTQAGHRYISERLNEALNRRIQLAAEEGLRVVQEVAGASDGALWTREEGVVLHDRLATLRRTLRLENLFVFDRDLRSLADARPMIRPGKAYTLVHLSPQAVQRVLAGKSYVDHSIDVESLSFRNAAVPLVIDAQVAGGVYAQANVGFERELHQLRRRWQVAGLLSVAICAALIVGLTAVHIHMGRLKDALSRRSRMDLVSLLSAGIAHDIKNPLTSISAAGELLQRRVADDPHAADLIQCITQGADRILDITLNLLGTGETTELEAIPLQAFVASLLKPLQPVAREKGLRVCADIDPGLTVWAPRSALQTALANILKNAVEAVSIGRGCIRITGRKTARMAGIAVSDNGPGIGRTMRRRIFKPLITTKRSGSGLGLAVTRQLLHDMHGSLDLETEPGVGSTFILWVPLVQNENG